LKVFLRGGTKKCHLFLCKEEAITVIVPVYLKSWLPGCSVRTRNNGCYLRW